MIPVRVEFRIKGPGADARLAIFVCCAALAVALELLVPALLPVSFLLLAVPIALLAAKPWTNKPKDQGEEDWQPAGIAELDRIADAFRASRKIKLPLWYRPAFGVPVTVLFVILAIVSSFFDRRVALVFVNAIFLFWPALHFLRVRIWVPRDLQMSMTCMQAALTVQIPENIVVTPYLRLDRDANGLRIPEDVRLMVEPRRSPEDLVGVQLQATINNGPNGPVPYLYAVVLTRGKGPTWSAAAAKKPSGFEVEKGGDEKYGTVVIRQQTSNGGYHTDEADCRHLMEVVLSFLKSVGGGLFR